MARKTNKAQVLELAAQLGVEVEYGQMGNDGFEVALYGYAAHMAFDPMGEGHTAITNQSGTGVRTESRIWGMALADLREFVPCADDCHCRAETDPDMIVTDPVMVIGVIEVRWDDGDAPRRDTDPAPELVAPIVTDDNGFPVVTRHYVIANNETGEEHTGSVIGCCAPGEAMRTMVGIVCDVSRETVRLWETDNYREYQFDTRPGGPRGTARFTDPASNPYRPAPVTLTQSNPHRNS